MINILYVTDIISHGSGVSSVIMSYIKNINKEEFKIDVVVHKKCDIDLVKQLKSYGSKIYELPDIVVGNILKYKKEFRTIIKENQYHIVHGHISNSAFLYMKEAKKQSIKHRIIHAHNPKSGDTFIKKTRNDILERNISKWANHFFACSDIAAKHLSRGQELNVKIIPNAIESEKFAYNLSFRQEIRKEFNLLEDNILIGHIGRLDHQKNHDFLIDVFNLLIKQNPNYRLMLVGNGSLKEQIIEKAKKLLIDDRIIVTGVRDDTEKLYSAFDVFVLPSHFEGFGIVGLEAQCSGLPCIFSNNVPPLIKVTEKVSFLSISKKEDIKAWMLEIEKKIKNVKRIYDINVIKNTDFDINHLIDMLEKEYIKMK